MSSSNPLSDSPVVEPKNQGNTRLLAPAAVLWDMDGTLMDSEHYWHAVERELVSSGGGTWTDQDAIDLVGSPLTEAAVVLHNAGAPYPPERIVEILVERVSAMVRADVPWREGGREILARLAASGIPCALVTMSYAPIAQALVDSAPAGAFTQIVTGEDVTHGKPHPEPYLRAAELLGVDVTQCIAVEDSPRGIEAALASGARTIGIRNLIPVAPAEGLSRVAELDQITESAFDVLMRGGTVDYLG